jgi:hypothetical protein
VQAESEAPNIASTAHLFKNFVLSNCTMIFPLNGYMTAYTNTRRVPKSEFMKNNWLLGFTPLVLPIF